MWKLRELSFRQFQLRGCEVDLMERRCPLWAVSGDFLKSAFPPLLRAKRTCRFMSTRPSKRFARFSTTFLDNRLILPHQRCFDVVRHDAARFAVDLLAALMQ